MSHKYFIFFILLFSYNTFIYCQLKIGDDVSYIDDTSILELESTSKVFVLTRITTSQMLSLKPLAGGMVYNTDSGCIHSYNGTNWNSLCDANSDTFSFEDNDDGTFTVNYSNGTSYTSQDLTGLQGEKGDQGDIGDMGATGIQGVKGDTGETGTQGIQGEKGDQGDIGDTGATGIQGAKGDTGETGETGAQGIQGEKGDQGDIGDTGATGIQGAKGDTGETGAQGVQGDKGDQGDIGDTGAIGIQGVKGDIGETGTQGIQGEKGDQGDIGDTGATGIQGVQGTTGAQGVKGDDGDPATDDQEITTDNTPGQISITGGNSISININDEDNNSSNEIQTLSIVADELSISGAGGNTITIPSGQSISGTEGSIFYADTDGSTTENNSQLFWNATNNRLGIGTDNPSHKLQVSGQVRATSFANADGTAGSPAYRFNSDSDTGIFRAAANQIGISTNGTEAIRISTNQNIGIGTNNPNSRLDISGSLATAIIKTSSNLALDDNHHTIILDGNHTITLPTASTSTGRMYIVKNPTGSDTSISQYQDQTGTSATKIPLETIVWLQSDGTEWQLINNIHSSDSSSVGGNGTNGSATTDFQVNWLDDGQFGTSNNFQLKFSNISGVAKDYEILIENAPYGDILNLNLVNHTYQVIDNGNNTYNHIFTSTTPLNGGERVINGGSNITPPGSGMGCGCISFYEL